MSFNFELGKWELEEVDFDNHIVIRLIERHTYDYVYPPHEDSWVVDNYHEDYEHPFLTFTPWENVTDPGRNVLLTVDCAETHNCAGHWR